MKTEQQYRDLTIKEFTKAAELYESNHVGIYEMCRDDYPYIAGELAREEFRDLLDCGCGTGPMISLLYEQNPRRNYTGIDLTPKMIEVARAKNLPGVRWVVGDCEDLPFDENSFDAVICSNSFHHYPNPQRFFHSIRRVLRPGGRLILQDYTAPKGILWLMNHTEMPLANLAGHGDVAAYSLDEVRRFCETAALRVEKLERGKKFRLHLVARKPQKMEKSGEAPAANMKPNSENKAMELKLGDIQATALIPLAIKANETTRPNPRIRDEMAVEIIRALNIDTKPYDRFMSHEGVVARTIMLDRQLREIIEKAPDTVVVNIGAGFDNRFPRVDNGRILWFDLDLPDTIAARRKAFPERDRVTMIAGDALESAWCGEVLRALDGRSAKPVFIAEGLFMYLTMEQIKTLLEVLKDSFPGGGLLIAEQNCKMMQKNEKHHDTVKNTNAHFVSGTDSGQEIADLTDGIRLLEEHSFNEEMKKYSIRAKLFALLLPKLNDRWATFAWGEERCRRAAGAGGWPPGLPRSVCENQS